jgi:hypothetical protein
MAIGLGKGGETSKVLPQFWQRQAGTSTTNTVGFRPMGTVANRRIRLPRRTHGPCPQSGQRNIFSLTAR